MNTRELYREQEFMFIDECSDWIARDYYGNDFDGLVSVFEGLKEWVDELLDRAKEVSK
jgi:hypothetical protein